MTQASREALLSQWIKPSSDDEKTQQNRAERMVTDAVKAHTALKSAALTVYPKGSYPNNTNVRRDSDVDIAVQSSVCEYYTYMPGQEPAQRAGTPYEGGWTPARLRAEVRQALISAFGASSITSGKVAGNHCSLRCRPAMTAPWSGKTACPPGPKVTPTGAAAPAVPSVA